MRIVRRNELLAEQKSVRVEVLGRPLVEIRRFPVGGVKHVLKYINQTGQRAKIMNQRYVPVGNGYISKAHYRTSMGPFYRHVDSNPTTFIGLVSRKNYYRRPRSLQNCLRGSYGRVERGLAIISGEGLEGELRGAGTAQTKREQSVFLREQR